MNRFIRWTCGSVYALLVGLALTFGATQAFATTTLTECPPESLETCPPWDSEFCKKVCIEHFYITGSCIGGCCICMM